MLKFDLYKIHRFFCHVQLQFNSASYEDCWIPEEYSIENKEIIAHGKKAVVFKILDKKKLTEGQILSKNLDATVISD